MIRLLLVRHGVTEWNCSGRYQGHADTPLSEEGLRQAALVGAHLSGEPLAAVYTSDLSRARQTAKAVATPHGLTAMADARLREICFGRWEGLTHAEIEQRFPMELAGWLHDPVAACPPEGETVAAVSERLAAAVGAISALHAEGTIALVGHGGAFQLLLCHFLGVDLARRWQFKLHHCSISEVHLYDEAAILMSLNDCHHLAEAAGA
ncbi:MAG: alpha-ribazole phosphatase [Anaerolineae bacterium]